VFDVADGFIAFVGPNNSGKSTVLKFFYETRSLWGALLGHFRNFPQHDLSTSFYGVADQSEPFCDNNNRPMTIQLDWPSLATDLGIRRLVLTIARNYTVSGVPLAGPKYLAIAGYNNQGLAIDTDSRLNTVDHVLDAFQVFSGALYIGPFRNAISEAKSTYFDLAIGTEFIALWDSWKTGAQKAHSLAVLRVQDEIRKIFGYKSLEVSAAENRTILHLDVDGKPYKLREVGAGLSQFLVVLANAAIRRPRLLLIDEPEVHLHPALQLSFLTALASYASDAVLFATHSIGLARCSADNVYSIQRVNGLPILREFGQVPNYAEFAGELSFASFKEMGFDTILLVEGVTEIKAFQQFLRLLNADRKVVAIPLGGGNIIKANAEEELAELGRLSDNVAVIIDSEREHKEAPLSTARQKFLEACNALGFRGMATERRAFENYLTDRAVKEQKGHSFRALEPYESLAEVKPNWKKNENWRIASVMTKEELLHSDLGKFLNEIVKT
jgi:ABC-type cobalamin/Fe3+-siderophores transport system ATPase subunit